jgi:uncharacterized protein
MPDLTLELPGQHYYIRAVSAAGIQVVDRWFEGSIIVSAERLLADWPPARIGELAAAHFAAILALEPDVVLIGTGARQHFLAPELMVPFYEGGVGAEVMSTAAACRTFNVLVAEGRKVVAALLPPTSGAKD